MTAHLPERRASDNAAAFQARKVVVSIAGKRNLLTATDAQFLLRELAKLRGTRWQAAESASTIVSVALSHGWPVAFAEDEERAVLRAVEGVRAHRALSPGLRSLRDALAAVTVG